MLEQLGLAGLRERSRELGLAMAGVALAFIGVFCPWFTDEAGGFPEGVDSDYSVHGIQGDDGKLVLLVALLALWLLLRIADRRPGRWLLGLLLAGLVVVGLVLSEILTAGQGATTTWGLWMTGVGGVFLTLGALMVANVRAIAPAD
jgi:hypothetical protein